MDAKDAPKSSLKQLFEAKINSSGITKQAAQQLGYAALTAQQTRKLGHAEVPALHIPYYNPAGQPTKFYRVRYLTSTKQGFAKQTTAKDQRYDQPPSLQPELYLPNNWKRKWADEFKQDTALFITEGELKAACACAHGFATLALGGVWNFCARKKGVPMLPIFDEMNLNKRQVFIVFDSDAVTNPQVAAAENMLCRELLNRKAESFIVRLPSLQGNKTGFDDYLLAENAAAFRELVEEATPYRLGVELHHMNEEVIYIENPSIVLRHSDGYKMSVTTFKNEVYAHKTFIDTTGDKPKQVKTATEWVRWEGRAVVNKFVYEPGQPLYASGNALNLWRGLAYEPKKGNVKPWTDLMEYIFAGDKSARKWFEQWLAYPLQHLGVKLFTAALIWSVEHGTGKTLIGHTMQRLYGADNSIIIHKDDLTRGNNSFAENKQFILGEEIAGDEKRGIVDQLKSLITNEELRINIKYVPEYSTRSCANYYFTSNNPDAFFLDEADRRFFIHELVGKPLSEDWYTGVYDPWYKSDVGAAALLHYFLHLDVSDFNPMSRAPMTSAKEAMIEHSRSQLSTWVHVLKVNPDKALRIGGATMAGALYTSQDLLKIFDPEGRNRAGARAMGVELTRAQIPRAANGQGCRTKAGQLRLWACREPVKYAGMWPTEVGKAYDDEHSNDDKLSKFSKQGSKEHADKGRR